MARCTALYHRVSFLCQADFERRPARSSSRSICPVSFSPRRCSRLIFLLTCCVRLQVMGDRETGFLGIPFSRIVPNQKLGFQSFIMLEGGLTVLPPICSSSHRRRGTRQREGMTAPSRMASVSRRSEALLAARTGRRSFPLQIVCATLSEPLGQSLGDGLWKHR